MPNIEWLGLTAMAIMVVSYGLESHSRVFVGSFAIGCLLAAFYAYLIDSYPFLVAELIWSSCCGLLKPDTELRR